MSFPGFLVQDVTVVHPAVREDRYGNAAQDWTLATRTAEKAWLAQTSTTTENTRAAIAFGRLGAVDTTWKAFLGPDSAVKRYDRLDFSGRVFDVVGDPKPAYTPRGLHHYEVDLLIVEG